MFKRFAIVSFAALFVTSLAGTVEAGKKCNGSRQVTHVSETPTAVAAPASKDIVDVAVGAGSFKTLVTAVQAAGLVDTLKSPGPFTVFAPTDEAFAALPAGTLDSLLKDKEKLKQVLLYHVVPGKVMAADVVKLKSAKTAEGALATVSVQGDVVKIDDAKVVKTDIPASNGVIHVIDKVILPPAK
ncbi:MAG: fasciclin domain-containing protein [Planctomycetota bacterium]